MARGFADVQNAIIGTPVFKGVIDGTTSSRTNGTGASATFALTAESTLLLHASAACFVLPVTSTSGAVTTATGVPLLANEKAVITLHPTYTHIAVITASGAVDLKIWELLS